MSFYLFIMRYATPYLITPMARPTKLTPKLKDSLLQAYRDCLQLELACDIVGVHRSTLHRWLAIGKMEGKKPYSTLYQDIRKVRAENLSGLQAKVITTAEGARWVMGRIDPHYDDKAEPKVLESALNRLLPLLDPDTRAKVIEGVNKLYPGGDVLLLGDGH